MTDPSLGAQVLDAALSAAEPTLYAQITTLKGAFGKLYGDLSRDSGLLQEGFEIAALAKLAVWRSRTPEAVHANQQSYQAALNGLQALGKEGVIVGKADAGPFLRQVAHVMILALAAGAGAGVTYGLEAVCPLLGLGPAQIAGAGTKALIEELDKLV